MFSRVGLGCQCYIVQQSGYSNRLGFFCGSEIIFKKGELNNKHWKYVAKPFDSSAIPAKQVGTRDMTLEIRKSMTISYWVVFKRVWDYGNVNLKSFGQDAHNVGLTYINVCPSVVVSATFPNTLGLDFELQI